MTGRFDEYGNYDPGPLEPGEKLLVDIGEPDQMALLRFDLNRSRYIMSFREAADTLVTSVMGGGVQDFLILPILFSYRHWLELQLKDLIILGARARGDTPEEVIGHDLRVLWPDARKAMEEAFPSRTSGLDQIESIVHELAEIDPNSMSFRYSRNRRGQPTLPSGIDRINVGHVAQVMLKVAMLLEGAADGMDDMYDVADHNG